MGSLSSENATLEEGGGIRRRRRAITALQDGSIAATGRNDDHMPLDGGHATNRFAPRDLGAIARAVDRGLLCEEAAIVLAEWHLEGGPSSRPPTPPRLPTNRWEEKGRGAWRERFARWYLWHSELRPNLRPTRPIMDALRKMEAKAARHIETARSLLTTLRDTGTLSPSDIPGGFDPVVETKLEAFRRIVEARARRREVQRRRLRHLDREGGFFRSLRSTALMRFVQATHAPPLLRAGVEKTRIFDPGWKLTGLDMPYVEGNKLYRSILRVDVDEDFASLEDLRERILACGVPLPNIVSWFLRTDLESAEAIPRPHLIWLIDRPVWWKKGGPRTLAWKSTLGRLTTALADIGADPGGMLNPMRVKNPLGQGCGWHVFDDVVWSLSDLAAGLPPDVFSPNEREPSLLEFGEFDDGSSQNLFRIVASIANRRARELRASHPEDGLERLREEILTLYEDRMRLQHGPLTPKQVESVRRQAERMAAFGWTLAGRGRPQQPQAPSPPSKSARKTREEKKADYLALYASRSRGGTRTGENSRRKLAEDMPLAVEACHAENPGKPIRASRLARFIDASASTLAANWNIVADACDKLNIPYVTPRSFHTIQAKRMAAKSRTIAHMRAVANDEVEFTPWRGNPNIGDLNRKGGPPRQSQGSTATEGHRPFVPRGKRRLTAIRLVGLPIGRPLSGHAPIDDLQACVDEIIARQGGLSWRLAHSWSAHLLRTLNGHITEHQRAAFQLPMSRAERLGHEARKVIWGRRQWRKRSLGKAIKAFPRVPPHMLLRAAKKRRTDDNLTSQAVNPEWDDHA